MEYTSSIIIPAYNAEKTLTSVISRIPEDAWKMISNIFIINDGSSDETDKISRQLISGNPKIKLISFDLNSGYGTAVKHGLMKSLQSGSEYIVCLHADGQYPPEKISEFLRYMHRNRVDILQGSRHKEETALAGGMPLYKYLIGKCLVRLENYVFQLNMTDFHSGFMFYSREALLKIPFKKLSNSFDFDLEMIVMGSIYKLNISELAIPTLYGDERSYLNPVLYGLQILRILYKYKTGFYMRYVDLES